MAQTLQIILGVWLLLVPLSGRSQAENDPVLPWAVNYGYLEHLIKTKIDSVREDHDLKTLVNDSILYVASAHHGRYLNERGDLTHEEKEFDEWETPQLRAEYYGAHSGYLVGENIAMMPIGGQVKDKKGRVLPCESYDEIAYNFVNAWVLSKGHYQNIITPEYQLTGLAIMVDTANKRVYAVQKFAQVVGQFEFQENKAFFNYSDWSPPEPITSFDGIPFEMHKGKHAYGLKSARDSAKQCADCYSDSNPYISPFKIKIEGRNIWLYSFDPAYVDALIDHKKDGFAVEVVDYDQYACGNPAYYQDPSRRNQQCAFSGLLLEPVYREQIRKGFKPRYKTRWERMRKYMKRPDDKEEGFVERVKKGRQVPPEYETFRMKVGKLPREPLNGYHELNLVIIQKGKICRIVHFSGKCGVDDVWDVRKPGINWDTCTYQLPIQVKALSLEIPFEKGKYQYEAEELQPMLDALQYENIQIQKLEVKAYSSVEGSREVNTRLQQQRAESIVSALTLENQDSVITNIETAENWPFFMEQIASNEALNELRGISEDSLKLMALDPEWASRMEPFLALQRKAVIQMEAKIPNTPRNRIQLLTDEYERHLTFPIKNDTLNWSFHQDSALCALQELSGYLRGGHMTCEEIQALSHDRASMSTPLFYLRAKINFYCRPLVYDDYTWLKLQVDQLMELLLLDVENPDADQAHYFVYLWLELQELDPDMANGMFSEEDEVGQILLKLWEESSTAERAFREELLVGYLTGRARWLHGGDPFNIRKPVELIEVLQVLGSIVLQKDLNLERRHYWAKFFTYYEQYYAAIALLTPTIEENTATVAMKSLYAKLLFIHPQEFPAQSYIDYLIQLKEELPAEDWCALFVGPCNISFQVFDHVDLRQLYCKQCSGQRNYAQDPNQWESQ